VVVDGGRLSARVTGHGSAATVDPGADGQTVTDRADIPITSISTPIASR
jgi:hypothetical protein